MWLTRLFHQYKLYGPHLACRLSSPFLLSAAIASAREIFRSTDDADKRRQALQSDLEIMRLGENLLQHFLSNLHWHRFCSGGSGPSAEASKGFGLLEWTGKVISQGTLVKGEHSETVYLVQACFLGVTIHAMTLLLQEQKWAGNLPGRP